MLAVAEARANDQENRKAAAVFMSGAAGRFADLINGPYAPSQKKGSDRRILYRKIGDDSICIQHLSHAERPYWQIQHVSQKNTQCFAIIDGGCALDSCSSHAWIVHSGTEFHKQPNVKMATGVKAEQAVSNNIHIYRNLQITKQSKFSSSSIFRKLNFLLVLCPFYLQSCACL